MNIRTAVFACFLWLSASIPAASQTNPVNTVLGLFNTGVDDSFSLLSIQDTDTHYSGGWDASTPNPLWTANDSNSQWITPDGSGLSSHAPGTNILELSFVIDGTNDPSRLAISGRWNADNLGEIYLNGNSTGNQIANTTVGSFSLWKPFSVASGFISGTNTFQFRITNLAAAPPNPTGLRVEFLAVEMLPKLPVIEDIAISGTLLSINCTADPNLVYQLQASPDLSNWSTIQSQVGPPGTNIFSFTESILSARRFYRIILSP